MNNKIMTFEEWCAHTELEEGIFSTKSTVDYLISHRNEIIKDRKLLQRDLGEVSPHYKGKTSLREKYLEVLNCYNKTAKALGELIELEKNPSQK